ncbi:cobalamin-dependent protein, partial [Neptuniibacter pectenicola]
VGASALIDEIKSVSPDLPVLLVGGHVSALPSETLDKTQADYVCQGEGILTSYELWQALQGECELEAVHGLVRRSNGG